MKKTTKRPAKPLTVWLARDVTGPCVIYRIKPCWDKWQEMWMPQREESFIILKSSTELEKGQCREYRLVAVVAKKKGKR